MIRAAIYCRVSTVHQDTERQERDLRNNASRAGHDIVQVVHETASGMKEGRKERAKLIAAARAGLIDVIWCVEASRWSRSLPDLLNTLHTLHAARVSLKCLRGLELDLQSPHGKLMVSVMGAFAEFERDLIAERVRSGLASAKAKGRVLGRRTGDKPTQRKHATEVRALRMQGFSIREIARRVRISPATVQAICNSPS